MLNNPEEKVKQLFLTLIQCKKKESAEEWKGVKNSVLEGPEGKKEKEKLRL